MSENFDREAFIDGYIEAALWADCLPPEDDPDGELGGGENLTLREGAREFFAMDCHSFINENLADLTAYCEHRTFDPTQGKVESYAGHDFWLTRNGHGAGFWDRDLGELGDRLARAAHAYGESMIRPFNCGDGTADA